MVDLRCSAGWPAGGNSKGSSCTGRKAKTRLMGLLQPAECLPAAASLAVVRLVGGQRHCCFTDWDWQTGGVRKWAQLSAMRAQGRLAGQMAWVGSQVVWQGCASSGTAGRIRSLKKNWNNQQSDALAIMTEDGGSWPVSGGSWSRQGGLGWSGWWAPADEIDSIARVPSLPDSRQPVSSVSALAWPGQTSRIDTSSREVR